MPDPAGPADVGVREVGGETGQVFLGCVVGGDEQDGQAAPRKARPRR